MVLPHIENKEAEKPIYALQYCLSADVSSSVTIWGDVSWVRVGFQGLSPNKSKKQQPQSKRL